MKKIDGISELPRITVKTDTRDVLAHATKEVATGDYFIVDVDAHVTETAFWSEITSLIDSDVYRQMADAFKDRGNVPGLLNMAAGMTFQDVFGRIPHQQRLGEDVVEPGSHPATVLTRRAMDGMGIDYMVVFPTPMLLLGMHPQPEVEAILGKAFNRWLVERILPEEKRLKGMLYLPYNHPDTCLEIVEKYASHPSVLGFMVTSTRYKAVHDDCYMPLYSAIEASGKPLGFHSGFHWGDQSMQQCNRFISMHAISFVYFNMIHLTNWIINGLPEKFPKLRTIWIESGLAWLPFMMQRLDSEYLMRSSEAPLLKRRPSEYMKEMYFTSQPLERTDLNLTKSTFQAINASTQLLYASDWPHWDFDPPSAITSLPFLNEQDKRNILGLNAARLFGLEVPKHKIKPQRAQSAPVLEPVSGA